jgi:hypothetical protein
MNNPRDSTGWSQLLFGIFQVAGLICMTLSDVDVNEFLRENPTRAKLFALFWLATDACWVAWGSPWYAGCFVPVIYFFARSDKVLRMQKAFPKFSLLFTIRIMLNQLGNAGLVFSLSVHTGGNIHGPLWPLALCSTLFFVSFLAMLITYRWAKQAMGFSPTIALNCIVYIYLCGLGVSDLALHLCFQYAYNISVAIPDFLFGPIHILPTGIMLIFRHAIYRYLGRMWLRKRCQNEGTTFVGKDATRGDIEEVDQAISAAIAALTPFYRAHTHSSAASCISATSGSVISRRRSGSAASTVSSFAPSHLDSSMDVYETKQTSGVDACTNALNAWIPFAKSTGIDALNAWIPANTIESPGIDDDFTLLIYAAANGYLLSVKRLLGSDSTASLPEKSELLGMIKADVHCGSRKAGQTALYFAAQNGHVEICKELIHHGADVNQNDVNGFGPLYMACMKGHVACAKMLIDAGAYAADFDQEILLVAHGRGHVAVVKFLVEEVGAMSTNKWMGLSAEDVGIETSIDARHAREVQEEFDMNEARAGYSTGKQLLSSSPSMCSESDTTRDSRGIGAQRDTSSTYEGGEVLSASLLYDNQD